MVFFWLMLGLGVAALFVVVATHASRMESEAWKDLARRTGLEHRPGAFGCSPVVEGVREGRPLRLELVRGAGGVLFTRAAIGVRNPGGLYLALFEDQAFPGARRAGDARTASDSGILGAYRCEASDAAAAGRVMDQELTRRIVWYGNLNLEINGREAALHVRGMETDGQFLLILLEVLAKVAERLE